MAKKYYAVRVGRNVGIYTTWADCEAQVKGYSGAQYKSFPTKEEAEDFVGHQTVSVNQSSNTSRVEEEKAGISLQEYFSHSSPPQNKQRNIEDVQSMIDYDTCDLRAFIDGSFDKKLGMVGSGGVMLVGEEELEFSLSTNDPKYVEYWNVSGELLAALHVVKYAIDHGYASCSLYYDYMGIEMWATGRWKTNNPLTVSYAKVMKEWASQIRIDFHKVKAHSGIHYNDRADALARKAILKK